MTTRRILCLPLSKLQTLSKTSVKATSCSLLLLKRSKSRTMRRVFRPPLINSKLKNIRLTERQIMALKNRPLRIQDKFLKIISQGHNLKGSENKIKRVNTI